MDQPENTIEERKAGRGILLDLEAENRYVFHGSENPSIDMMEPRQAYNYKDDIQEPDGDPAVFASSKVDYAILMAIVNSTNCPQGYHSSAGTQVDEKGEVILKLWMDKQAYDQLTDSSEGYVYVFDRDLFVQRNERGVEYMSKAPVTSVRKVRVTKGDLPTYVEVG